MIRDSLVYWAQNLGVDGFRFDLASTLERDPNGNFHQDSELLWELKNDLELAVIKIIALGCRWRIPSRVSLKKCGLG